MQTKTKDRLRTCARASRREPDAAGAGPAPRGDGASAEPQPSPAWHGRAERPAAVGVPAREGKAN